MSVDQFPKYIVLKCMNMEELTTVNNLNITQIKVTTDLSELAKNESFVEIIQPKPEDATECIEAFNLVIDEPLHDINEIASPDPEITKISSGDVHYLTDDNKPYDRILMVENTKFYIQSDKLIDNSDYFCSMFTNDFKEKNQEIISIKVFNSEKIKLFMDALYKSDSFEVTEENLETIIETFVYFQAVTFLVELFEEKNVFENIPTEKLLKIFDYFGFIELKNIVEQFLIEKIHENFQRKALSPFDHKYIVHDKLVRNSLKLTKEFQLTTLHDIKDTHLTSEFNRNLPYSLDNIEYRYLLEWYKLVKLTNAIETYAVRVIDGPTDFLVARYLFDEAQIQMTHLKNAIGDSLLKEFNENKPIKPHFIEKYLKLNQKCEHLELKERICRTLEELYKDKPSKITWEKYNELIFNYQLKPFKSHKKMIQSSSASC